MIELPRHLAPWGPELDLFPESISLSLGALVLPLAAVLGGGRAADVVTGEPAGYDGIERRGPYHRLLASEWLLADEAPDEFLRRAIAGEHAFLRRAQAGEAAGRRCVVLFDAGPDQLGAPRLAHLAALVLLAARARRQRAVLEWAVLQDATGVPPDPVGGKVGVTRSNVLELLRGRSLRPASAHDVDRWIAELDRSPRSELWLVGGDDLARHGEGRGARTVTIEDVIDPDGPPRLRLVARGDVRAREVVLEVPAEQAAVQLLRDPFGAAVPPRRPLQGRRLVPPLDPDSSLVFAFDGRRLYVRGTGPEVVGLHVPGSPRAAPGSPSVFIPPEGQTAIAVGRSGGGHSRTLIVTRVEADGSHLVHTLSRRGASTSRSGPYQPDGGASWSGVRPDLVPLVSILPGAFAVHFVDPTGALIELRGGRSRILEPDGALAPRATPSCLAWATLRGAVPRAVRAVIEDGEFQVQEDTEEPDAPPMQGERFVLSGGARSLLAYPTSPTTWQMVERRGSTTVHVPAGHHVVAVMIVTLRRTLVVLDPTRTRVSLIAQHGTQLALTTSSPMTQVAVGPSYTTVALLTRAGEVIVFSGEHEAVILRAGATS